MSIWRTRLRHERPERPGVQSPRADVRSARACVRQSSFCEAQDVLHSRQALSHLFLAASICEALTSRRTRASSVRRGLIRGTAPQSRGPCLRASMVGCPSGYGGFPYQRNTFCSRWRSSPMPPSRTSGRGPLGHPATRCREASAGTRGHSGGRVARSASMLSNLWPASSASSEARGEGRDHDHDAGGAPKSCVSDQPRRSVSPTHSAHLTPSQPREDATCERSPLCELASDGLGVGTVGAQSRMGRLAVGRRRFELRTAARDHDGRGPPPRSRAR